jgi:hypothetical protein
MADLLVFVECNNEENEQRTSSSEVREGPGPCRITTREENLGPASITQLLHVYLVPFPSQSWYF